MQARAMRFEYDRANDSFVPNKTRTINCGLLVSSQCERIFGTADGPAQTVPSRTATLERPRHLPSDTKVSVDTIVQ